jgi:hypothetical protein
MQADPSEIQALHKLLVSPEFAGLQLPVQSPGADQFIYELTVPGRAKPIVTMDGADNPPVLREMIDLLEKLKSAMKRQSQPPATPAFWSARRWSVAWQRA